MVIEGTKQASVVNLTNVVAKVFLVSAGHKGTVPSDAVLHMRVSHLCKTLPLSMKANCLHVCTWLTDWYSVLCMTNEIQLLKSTVKFLNLCWLCSCSYF